MANDRIFAKGLFFNQKSDKQPDFVLGSISISAQTIAELAAQVEEYQNDKGYCRFQITLSREGKPVVSVDTYGLATTSEPVKTKPVNNTNIQEDLDNVFGESKARATLAREKSNAEVDLSDVPFR